MSISDHTLSFCTGSGVAGPCDAPSLMGMTIGQSVDYPAVGNSPATHSWHTVKVGRCRLTLSNPS
jgi:hypothetical protein